MIRLIEALNFRCLRDIHQPLTPLHVLVGPNASGKTTFLDVVSFLGKLVSQGPDAAIEERTQNFEDLLWMRQGSLFELAIEAEIPEDLRGRLPEKGFDTIRYEVALGIDRATGERSILSETVLLKVQTKSEPRQLTVFPEEQAPRPSILLGIGKARRVVINKVQGGNDNFYSEVYGESGKGWAPAFKLGPRRSALGNLPEDESKFPASTWLKRLLADGVQQLVLNSLLIRKASPPGQAKAFKPDGSNLPWVLESLQQREPERYGYGPCPCCDGVVREIRLHQLATGRWMYSVVLRYSEVRNVLLGFEPDSPEVDIVERQGKELAVSLGQVLKRGDLVGRLVDANLPAPDPAAYVPHVHWGMYGTSSETDDACPADFLIQAEAAALDALYGSLPGTTPGSVLLPVCLE